MGHECPKLDEAVYREECYNCGGVVFWLPPCERTKTRELFTLMETVAKCSKCNGYYSHTIEKC